MGTPELLGHPLVQSVAVPLAVGLLGGAIAARLVSPRAAGAAAALGFLASAWLVFAGVAWPPRSLPQKLPFCVGAALAAGALLDAATTYPATNRIDRAVRIAVPLGALWWLASGAVASAGAPALAALTLVAVATGAHLATATRNPAASRGAPRAAALLVIAIGLAGIAAGAASLSLAQLAAALAAALGGFLLGSCLDGWRIVRHAGWPRSAWPLGAVLDLPISVALAGIATALVLLTRASPFAVAGVFLALAAPPLAALAVGRLGPRNAVHEAAELVSAFALSAVPTLLALLAARTGSATDNPYLS